MNSKTTFIVGLAITFVGGLIVYSALTPGDINNTASPRVAGLTNTSPTPGTVQPTSGHVSLAPDFTLEKLDGSTVTLSDYRGDKPVILDFFATWCHNCQRAMPQLSRMYDKYKGQVEVIGVNLRENKSTVNNFISSRGISFPISLDAGRVANQYGIRYTNTHVLINKDGSIAQTIPGDLRESHILSLIQ